MNTVSTYIRQVRFRAAWFTLALLVGVVVGLVVDYAGVNYPPLDAGLLAAGVVFFPVYLVHINRKGYVSTLEAWRARGQVRR